MADQDRYWSMVMENGGFAVVESGLKLRADGHRHDWQYLVGAAGKRNVPPTVAVRLYVCNICKQFKTLTTVSTRNDTHRRIAYNMGVLK